MFKMIAGDHSIVFCIQNCFNSHMCLKYTCLHDLLQIMPVYFNNIGVKAMIWPLKYGTFSHNLNYYKRKISCIGFWINTHSIDSICQSETFSFTYFIFGDMMFSVQSSVPRVQTHSQLCIILLNISL